MDAAAIVTPVQSQEYEECVLEKLWDGTLSHDEWAALGEDETEGEMGCHASTLVRFPTMMVQDLQNPEYFLPSGSSSQAAPNWSERSPVHLVPYPFESACCTVHRDKRLKTTIRSGPILAYFYHDLYPTVSSTEPHQRASSFKMNELVDVVAIPAAAALAQSIDSMEEQDIVHTDDSKETPAQGWHILWFQRHSLYDGTHGVVQSIPPPFERLSLPHQALALLLHSRTERTITGQAVVTPDDCLLGCANLYWTVQNTSQRDALVRVLPEPYTMLTHEQLETTPMIPRRNASGRLRQSALQLPAGALLVVDLCGSKEPHASYTVLQHVMKTHTLDYAFEGNMRIPFEADYRILIIAQCDTYDVCSPENTFTVQLDPGSDRFPAFPAVSDRVELPSALLETVVAAYTTLDASEKTADVLHRWLIATRSMARYHGRTTATMEDWDMAFRLERKLRGTLSVVRE